MKKLLAVTTMGLLGAAAFAQDASPIAFRLGLAFPVISNTRDLANEFYGLGFQYKLNDLNSSDNYKTSVQVSFDYYGRGDFRHIPILLNYVGESTKGSTFWSVGAGFGFVGRPNLAGTDTESIGRLAYQAGVGLNLNGGATPSFVEVKFFGSEASTVNSLGVYFGIKF